jgi:hypothetical protein
MGGIGAVVHPLLLLLRGEGVGDLALVLVLASLVFSHGLGWELRQLQLQGLCPHRWRRSSASQQHDMGPRGSGDDIAIVFWPCLTFYLSFHRISNQNLTPRSCILSETVRAVRRDSRVMAVVGQSSSTSHRAEQFLMIMASRKLKFL